MRIERQVEDGIVILSVSGVLGDDDLSSIATQLEQDPEIKPNFSLLIDLRQADGRSVTSAGVRGLAERSLVFSSTSRRAVVVPSPLGFGMARMYETLREGRGAVHVFRDFDEARRWLAASSQ